jgi:predicted lipoprotein with Yx(FWY)xxD motif
MMKLNFLNTRTSGVLSLFLVAMLVLSACQAAPAAPEATAVVVPTETAAPVVPTESSAASTTGVVLQVADDPNLGEILVDDQGMTLYMFTVDEPNQSNCNEGCLQAWPPLLAEGEVEAGEGVNSSLIGTGTMLDGRSIVTYNDMPLYYWAGDAQPGDTSGQGVNDVWYVVSPEGEVIGLDETMPVTGPTGDEVVVNTTTHSTLGEILVDSEGMTLYMFTVDEPNKSNCSGPCLQAWPPLLADGDVAAGEGVDETLLGTAPFEDGQQIVTYNEMPLYYWAGDSRPGDTNGQNVNNVWFVVSPLGSPVGLPESDAASDDYAEPDY